jgi:hypothetical protein
VEWLAEEEAAEEAAGNSEAVTAGLVEGAAPAGRAAPDLDDVVASVARGSMDVLARGVRSLFTRYVSEVAGLSVGRGEAGPGEAVDAETAVLVGAVADDPAALSYLVASAALLTTEDRQALLAESATRRRLAAESRLLRRELTMLTTLSAVPAPLHEFATPMTVN